MIALFARANHPLGYGYGPWVSNGTGRAHGYVVVGVRCRNRTQLRAVVAHVRDAGLDLPDEGRRIYPASQPEKPYQRTVWAEGVVRWYSGGPNDWDYLFMVPGNTVEWPAPNRYSRGDNRFVCVYEAKDVLDSPVEARTDRGSDE